MHRLQVRYHSCRSLGPSAHPTPLFLKIVVCVPRGCARLFRKRYQRSLWSGHVTASLWRRLASPDHLQHRLAVVLHRGRRQPGLPPHQQGRWRLGWVDLSFTSPPTKPLGALWRPRRWSNEEFHFERAVQQRCRPRIWPRIWRLSWWWTFYWWWSWHQHSERRIRRSKQSRTRSFVRNTQGRLFRRGRSWSYRYQEHQVYKSPREHARWSESKDAIDERSHGKHRKRGSGRS